MNRPRIRVVWLAAACAALVGADATVTASPNQLSDVREGLRSYLERFTGPNAINCDRPGVPGPIPAGQTPLDQVMQCVAEAKLNGRPFFVYGSRGVTDSWTVSGILTTLQGEGYLFSYDSSPCGGLGCSDRFVISHCENPRITGLGIGLTLECDPVPSPYPMVAPVTP